MTEAEFLAECRDRFLRNQHSATPWVDDHCRIAWDRAVATTFMAEAILDLVPSSGSGPLSAAEARARLSMVRWESESAGTLNQETQIDLSDTADRVSIYWHQLGMASPYNIVDALRVKGVTLHPLGCPVYPAATMGREKVMVAERKGESSFILTVYVRSAPTGSELGLYQVDADFSGTIPEMATLRSGHYPGGGGRAFATDPTGWVRDCPDPD